MNSPRTKQHICKPIGTAYIVLISGKRIFQFHFHLIRRLINPLFRHLKETPHRTAVIF